MRPASGDLESSQSVCVEKERSKKRLADTLSDKLFERERLDRQLERRHVTGSQVLVVIESKSGSLTVLQVSLSLGLWVLAFTRLLGR